MTVDYKYVSSYSETFVVGGCLFMRNSIVRAGETFEGRVPELSVNFEEILSGADGNIEERGKVLGSYYELLHCL